MRIVTPQKRQSKGVGCIKRGASNDEEEEEGGGITPNKKQETNNFFSTSLLVVSEDDDGDDENDDDEELEEGEEGQERGTSISTTSTSTTSTTTTTTTTAGDNTTTKIESLFQSTKFNLVRLNNYLPLPGHVHPVSIKIYPFLQDFLSASWELVRACRQQESLPYRRELRAIEDYDFCDRISPCLSYAIRQVYPMIRNAEHFDQCFIKHLKCVIDLCDGFFDDDDEFQPRTKRRSLTAGKFSYLKYLIMFPC